MKKSWIVLVAILAVCALSVSCGDKGFDLGFGKKEEAPTEVTSGSRGFTGTYKVGGDGYTATLVITETGRNYHLVWTFPDGSAYYGKGLEVAGVLGVVYEGEAAGGIAAYKKSGTGITGLWAGVDDEELYYERSKNAAKLQKSRRDIEGDYEIEGTNPDGGTYTGQLSIVPTGETWAAMWLTGGEAYGMGLVVDEVVVLGYGTDDGLGVAVYEITGSTLDGVWLYTSFGSLSSKSPLGIGTEKAKK